MLKNKGIEMKKSPEMYNAWKSQWEKVAAEIAILNVDDRSWLDYEYSTWFKENFKEDIKRFNKFQV